ncbi:hypothetical protein COB18_02385 [Candidatus Kaiserbacteria bacterium]|nr:MAG: hypothetical protein COB80_00775 [Candidatus Kaiserbacteria bacterium]PCI89948.1 MAG: hypothetical protein COB18_02385 [Candidatus Kaiserbacteria bacterium]
MNKLITHSRKRTNARGFTLIELIVVLGILTVISGVTLTSYSKFGGQMLLRNLAYDVALSIRGVQVSGISARSFRGTQFTKGHGLSFDIATANREFFLYADVDDNRFYTSAATEWIETVTIGNGYAIDSICIPTGVTTENCNITELDILFRRPEPDAIIRASDGSGFNTYTRARIVIKSPQGEKLSVLVETTGQISVQR